MKTMKISKPSTLKRVGSMKELKQEKARLRREMEFSEEKIQVEYRLLVEAFTIRNLVNMVMDEMMKTSTVFSQALQFGKSIFKTKKKKKRSGFSPAEGDNNPPKE